MSIAYELAESVRVIEAILDRIALSREDALLSGRVDGDKLRRDACLLRADSLVYADDLRAQLAKLQGLLVHVDPELPDAPLSAGELVPRARTAAVLLLLDDIKSALPDPASEMFSGCTRIRTVDALIEHIHEQLRVVNRTWKSAREQERPVVVSCIPVFNSHSWRRYRGAVRGVFGALARIGSDSDVMCFLRAGMTAPEHAQLSNACAVISTLLGGASGPEADVVRLGAVPHIA